MQFFEEMKEYVGFDQTDAQHLSDLRPVVRPHFEEIVDHFYESLLDNERTRNVFSGQEQLERLHRTLQEWLEEVFSGPYDEDYYRSRRTIGTVHVEVGLLPRFMFGAMNLIRSKLLEILDDADRSISEAISVERILDLELSIMVQSYWDTVMEQKFEVPATLATGLAHEIRNPLNTLNLQMTLLRRRISELDDGLQEEEFEPILESVENDIDRIRTLTKDITNYAKPLELDPGWHSTAAFANEIAEPYEASLASLGIELEIDFDEDDEFWGDIPRLQQAFANLIQNSVEAIDGDGRVAIEIRTSGEGAKLTIEDDGEGIPSEQVYDIFEMFHTTRASGTGMGLPIVRKIVNAHDGSIEVGSEPGQGTRFTIYLPFP